MNRTFLPSILPLTSLLLIVMSFIQGASSLNLFILFFYLISTSFIQYKSSAISNLIHISWMSLCLSLVFCISHFYLQILLVSLLPISLLAQSLQEKSLRPFSLVQGLNTILFWISIPLLQTHNVQLAFFILVSAILMRQVQFPFHFWLKNTKVKRELFPSFLYLILVQSGLVLYSQGFLYNEITKLSIYFIPSVTLLTGLLTSVAALREKDQLVKHLLLIVSQSCLPLAAFYSHDTTSVTGGVMFALLLSIGGGVCGLVAYQLYLQKGIITLDKHYSLYRTNKNLSIIYFVSSLSIVGLPFTLGYIAEDILFHGLVEHHPYFAIIYILMTAINGFNAFKNFNMLFLGHIPSKTSPIYFKMQNKLAITLSMIFLVLGGVLSGPFASKIEAKILQLEHHANLKSFE